MCFNSNVHCHCHFLRASIIRLIIAFFVSLYSGNKPVRGRTAGVQGRVSRWNELRSSSTAPFFGHSAGWSSGEAFGWRKEQYSTMRECCSTYLSNYGSRTHHHYIMAPPLTPKSYKYSSPFGLRGIQSVWCTSDWQPRNRLQTSDSAPGRPLPLGSVKIPQ